MCRRAQRVCSGQREAPCRPEFDVACLVNCGDLSVVAQPAVSRPHVSFSGVSKWRSGAHLAEEACCGLIVAVWGWRCGPARRSPNLRWCTWSFHAQKIHEMFRVSAHQAVCPFGLLSTSQVRFDVFALCVRIGARVRTSKRARSGGLEEAMVCSARHGSIHVHHNSTLDDEGDWMCHVEVSVQGVSQGAQ